MNMTDGLQETLDRYAAGLHARDLEAVLACFAEDADVMAPETETVTGQPLREMYQKIVDTWDLDITFSVEHSTEGPDEAAAFTESRGTRTAVGGGPVAPVRSREAFWFVRQDDNWKIGRYLYNRLVHVD